VRATVSATALRERALNDAISYALDSFCTRREHMMPNRRPKGTRSYAGVRCRKCIEMAIKRLYGKAFRHGWNARTRIETT
jgi:hypothetical protein